jgi:hypothetical protein
MPIYIVFDPHPLDIPEKTIDLPQFTDKLDLINWTSLRKPSTCHGDTVVTIAFLWNLHLPSPLSCEFDYYL